MTYYQKNDSGICLGGNSEPKPLQSPEDSGPKRSIMSSSLPHPLYAGMYQSIHYSQLTESQRLGLLSGCYNIPPPSQESTKAKILSGYPIPSYYNLVPKPAPQRNEPTQKQLQPGKKEPKIPSPASLRPRRRRNPRQEKAERFFDMCFGGTPKGYQDFVRKFPAEYEHEVIKELRWHAAELTEELNKLSQHYRLPGPAPYNGARPHCLNDKAKQKKKNEEEEAPERWFNSIEEAWAHRNRLSAEDGSTPSPV
jgi:hypothetical protein